MFVPSAVERNKFHIHCTFKRGRDPLVLMNLSSLFAIIRGWWRMVIILRLLPVAAFISDTKPAPVFCLPSSVSQSIVDWFLPHRVLLCMSWSRTGWLAGRDEGLRLSPFIVTATCQWNAHSWWIFDKSGTRLFWSRIDRNHCCGFVLIFTLRLHLHLLVSNGSLHLNKDYLSNRDKILFLYENSLKSKSSTLSEWPDQVTFNRCRWLSGFYTVLNGRLWRHGAAAAPQYESRGREAVLIVTLIKLQSKYFNKNFVDIQKIHKETYQSSPDGIGSPFCVFSISLHVDGVIRRVQLRQSMRIFTCDLISHSTLPHSPTQQ